MVCVSEIPPHAPHNQILSRNRGRCAKQSRQALTSDLLAGAAVAAAVNSMVEKEPVIIGGDWTVRSAFVKFVMGDAMRSATRRKKRESSESASHLTNQHPEKYESKPRAIATESDAQVARRPDDEMIRRWTPIGSKIASKETRTTLIPPPPSD